MHTVHAYTPAKNFEDMLHATLAEMAGDLPTDGNIVNVGRRTTTTLRDTIRRAVPKIHSIEHEEHVVTTLMSLVHSEHMHGFAAACRARIQKQGTMAIVDALRLKDLSAPETRPHCADPIIYCGELETPMLVLIALSTTFNAAKTPDQYVIFEKFEILWMYCMCFLVHAIFLENDEDPPLDILKLRLCVDDEALCIATT